VEIIFTEHSRFEIQRRQINENDIKELIKQPQQTISTKKGRLIYQKKYFDNPMKMKKEILLRVIGKKEKERFTVITAYKTSKIKKYWIKGGN